MKARPMPQAWMGQASLAVMATFWLAAGAWAEPLPPLAGSTLTLDTTLSSGPIAESAAGSGTRYEIGETNGTRPGGAAGINLLQGFELFELAEQDTAHFSADPARTTENIVVRVSEAPTRIEGRLESGVQGAHLYWLSPEGVIFGPRAELDVPGSLTVSTAESLRFRDAGQVETFEARAGGTVPTLALARPEAFGFLGDASQRIVFESSVICGAGYGFCGGAQVRGDLSLHGGGVDLLGGTVFLINSRDVTIAATESIEISGLEPPEDDPMERGSAIFITNGDVEEGGNIHLEADRIHLTDGAAVWIANHQGTTTSGGHIELRARSSIRLDGSDERNQPLGPLTLGQGGTPNLNDLERTLQLGSADILTLGSDVDGSGNVGAISLHAPIIELLDGAEVTTYAFGSESADITLTASERLELGGRGGGPSQAGSVVQSRNPGFNGAGQAGNILVNAGDVLLRDGASLAVDTAGRGHAGAIEIEASRLALLGGSRLRSASTATTTGLGGAAPGQAGLIDVSAHRVILSGASEISVFAAEGPPVPSDLGEGEPSPPGVNEGNISIVAKEFLLLEGGSKVEASVDTGLGGSIQIGSAEQPTTALVVREGSAVLAQASGDGATYGGGEPPGESDGPGTGGPAPAARGGDISIHATSVLTCPDCAINADGPTEGTGGSVVINNPETALDSQARPAPIHYLDAASLLLAECGAEQTGAEGAGRLAVARWPGRAFSPEAPLLALAPLGSGLADRRNITGNDDPASAYAIALNTAGETLRGGRTGRAAAEFESLERQAAESHDPAAQADALRGLGESRQAAGAYAASLEPLTEALDLARASGDPAREAAALGALANAQVAQGDFDEAEQALGQALALTRADGDGAARGLTVALLNNLGSERALAGRPQAALDAYAQSAAEARRLNDALALAQAEANAARTALGLGDEAGARAALGRAHGALEEAAAKNQLTDAEATALHIHLAHSEARLARQDPGQRRAALLRAHRDLSAASRRAQAAGDARATSYALGSLGALYADEGGRDDEALHLTRRALKAAEQARAADLLARWNAQAGQLAWRSGEQEAALDAYRRAVRLLAETRPEAGAARGQADVAFRQTVEPIYLELVDLLLRASTNAGDAPASQALLAEARQVVEDWKAAELRNYFRDGCAAELQASARSIESIDPRAAVVYPILLPDRLELLVGRAGGITRYAQPIPRAQVEAEAQRLLGLLTKRTTHEYRGPARQLHEWLVAPFEADLESAGIDTLVFVPGGALRTVPMAALHDGDSFLLERYAVAITPSMNLLAPKPIAVGERSLLLAGLSEAVQGYPALPGVPGELDSIQSLYGGEVLLDGAFERDALERSLLEDRPGLVHIASHAEFSGDPDTSFVLTHSDQLSIDDLAQLIRAGRYGEEPVELLMLSACATASGNERAALGLAGVAVRAGARSAMGSLWPVSDQATSALVSEFYSALDQPGVSKARALQSAQARLLADSRYAHPYYWAPFLVINNWL